MAAGPTDDEIDNFVRFASTFWPAVADADRRLLAMILAGRRFTFVKGRTRDGWVVEPDEGDGRGEVPGPEA